jgi:hypothetical protein
VLEHGYTIVAGGKERTLSSHAIQTRRPGITNARISFVIDNWQLRGIYSDPQTGRDSRVYLAFVPGMARVVRVAVSMDGSRILSAFPDRNATRNLARGNRDYFADKYRDLEERDDTES